MEAEPETKVVEHDSKVTAELPAADALAPSSFIGRYQLIQRLGHGGMATVYLARAEGKAGFEKLVAIKVIHPHLANEPDFLEMFLDEARIAARIHHPHVVEILDLGESDGLTYMVMEYVEGETLSGLIRVLRKDEELLPIPVVLQIVTDACEGIGAAHELEDPDGNSYKLVHRDVSPQNLLVGVDGWVKVVDFGIMKAAGKRSNTLTGQLRGKLPYMSPEQARGENLDLRTDLFAMGVVLWELLTNERVFQGGSEAKTIDNVTACKIPDIATRRPDLPAGLREVLHRALAARVEDRYTSADEMVSDLRAVQRRFSGEANPRKQLAAVMRHHFGKRVDYARAAARAGASMSSAVPLRTPLEESTRLAGPSSSGVSHRTRENPTLTSTLAAAPARHWGLWLLLPLLGAAIGTAVVTWNSGAAESGTMAVEPPDEPRNEPVVPEVLPATVKWLFNTDPQGATVLVGGKAEPGVTPLSIEVPRSDEALTVRMELEGHEPREVRLAPLKSDNYNFSLDAIPREGEGKAPVAGPMRLTAPSPASRPKKRKQDGGSDPGSAKAEGERTLDPMPDFKNLATGQVTSAED